MAEMWITKNDVTGEATLKLQSEDQRQRNLNALLRLIEENPFIEDFIPPRDDAWCPDPFADGIDPVPEQGTKS